MQYGFRMASDIRNEFAQTFIRNLDETNGEELGEALSGLGRQARSWLDEEGIAPPDQELHYELDVRYFRQGYEFSLQVDPGALANGGLQTIQDRFGALHEQQYGFKLDAPVELVNMRAVGAGSGAEGSSRS